MPRFVEIAKKSQIPENGVIGVEVEATYKVRLVGDAVGVEI